MYYYGLPGDRNQMRMSNLLCAISAKQIYLSRSILIQRSNLVYMFLCMYFTYMHTHMYATRKILFINYSSPFLCHWHSFSCINTCLGAWQIKRAMSKVVLIAQALLELFLHSETQKTLNGVRGLYWEVLPFRTLSRWFTYYGETLSCTDEFMSPS